MKLKKFLSQAQTAWSILILAAVITTALILTGTLRVSLRDSQLDTNCVVAKKRALYRCPMHPSVTSDHPDRCPICHMDLQKVDDDETETSGQEAADNVFGRSGFSLSRDRQQLIGVATADVSMRDLSYEVRATGKAAFDPDLFNAIEEYRQAIKTQSEMKESPYAGLRGQAGELVASSKTKLRLMGLGEGQIHELANGNVDSMNLLLPRGAVWIYAEVFEYEVGNIRIGQKIEVLTPGLPGKSFAGKVSSVSPVVNGPTRSVRVRALVADAQGSLRPDTSVNVVFRVELGSKLSVPEDAVLHSGSGTYVFVAKGEGRFDPREVRVGVKTREFYEILSGLTNGENVVSAANFLIDSESRLRSALQNMTASPHGASHND